jgi:hypothetical protein
VSKFALLFLLVFFGGIYAIFAYNGAVAFILYQLVYFLNPGDRWWAADIPGLRYSLITVLLMLIVLVRGYRDYTVASPWMEMPALKWMFTILFFYYLAYSFALNMPAHSKFTFEFTKLIVIIFIAYKLIDSKKMLDACLWAYLTGCTYIGYLATSKGRVGGRVEGIGMVDSPDANGTAAALVPAAVLLMYFAWQGNNKIKLLAACMGALIANGLVLINSRGAFLGVVASLGLFLMYMIFSRFQKKGQRASAILMIVLGLSGALYVTDDVFWERMQTLKSASDGSRESGASRVFFWLTTFDMLEERPWGLGIGGYNLLAPQYMDDDTRGGVEFRSVHSSWFQGLSEIGWLGFGVFLGMLLSLYKISNKAKKFVIERQQYSDYFKLLALECSFLGFLASATFINRFRAEILYWMILFVAVAVKLYYLQPRKAQQEAEITAKANRDAVTNE